MAKYGSCEEGLESESAENGILEMPELPRGHLALLAAKLLLKLPISASSKLDNP